MPHFMIVLILYINLLNLSWIKKIIFLRGIVPLYHLALVKQASWRKLIKISQENRKLSSLYLI